MADYSGAYEAPCGCSQLQEHSVHCEQSPNREPWLHNFKIVDVDIHGSSASRLFECQGCFSLTKNWKGHWSMCEFAIMREE